MLGGRAARSGNYDLALIGYPGLGGDPDLPIRIRYSPAAVALTFKAHGYRSPQLEELGQRQSFTGDASIRRTTVEEMQRLVADDLPVISL